MLTRGSRIGHYEIVGLLGVGGMGEVYRARDPKLNRDIALKVLPEVFTADVDRLTRFRREAQVLASLNHPNIAHIHGFEDSAATGSGLTRGTHALVLELVDGPTLADCIAEGPIGLDEALPIARQIADALEYAHEQGIVHRDLKPANIKVRADGTVKVLDFGLAKAIMPEGAGATADVMNSPTVTAHGTQLGVIAGTAAYMAPEQARGRPADRRVDIWAFGVVLYEMLTGTRPFRGDDISITLASVLKDDVDWKALPPDLPASVRRLLRRCLEKDPRRRLSAIADARLELDDVSEPAGAIAPSPAAGSGRPRTVLPWSVAGIAVAAAMTAAGLWALWQKPDAPGPLRIHADLDSIGPLALNVGAAAVVSPDGTSAVFVGEKDGRNTLYLRRLDQLHPTLLTGTEDAHAPFFSPDSQWIAFFTPGKLKKIAAAGGGVVTLCDAPTGRGGWWGEDGTIVFQPSSGAGAVLHKVSAAGGTPTPLGNASEGHPSQRWPQILPGGRALIYTAYGGTNWENSNIVVQPLPAGERKVVWSGGYHGRYAAGHLFCVRDGTLFAVRFDPERLEVRGTPTPVIEGVRMVPSTGGAQFSITEAGTLLYVPGAREHLDAPVHWMDRHGRTTVLRSEVADWTMPRFSPAGDKLAMTIGDRSTADVWVYDIARDVLTKLTFGGGSETAPVWTPDGARIAYASAPPNSVTSNIYWKRADGTGDVQRLTDSPYRQTPSSFHPSGKYLALTEVRPDTGSNIMVLPLEGDDRSGWKPGTPTALLGTVTAESTPAFSPDGRWLAYTSSETTLPEVYVRPFGRADGKWKISDRAGTFPTWSARTHELLFAQPGTGMIMASKYEADGTSFRHERPRPWAPAPGRSIRNSRFYDVHPDGERVAMRTRPDEPERQERPVFVFNFLEELRRISPEH